MEAKLQQAHICNEPSKLPYKLIRQITNDFDEERILGRGGFGTVYKGVYEDGREIAVKVLHNNSGVDDHEFHKEFDNLRGLKHPNIVELVGFCHEWEKELAESEGKQVTAERLCMALCFEYVQKGSLHKFISDENTGFTWRTRYKIIKGICVGLQYLRGREHPIMHFDLKPDNILLDESMTPKIADFGLSRLFGEENTKKTMSAAGTCGYWPPEYIKHQVISREFDIFSLGVIIVRIMAGHESYNSIVEIPRRKSVNLVQESWRKSLSGTMSHTTLEGYCNQVKRCIELALDCLISNRQERPTIEDIVLSLDETEAMIGDQGMQNDQFYQADGESTLPSDIRSTTTSNTKFSSGQNPQDEVKPKQTPRCTENFVAVEPRVMSLSLLKEMTDDFSQARLIGWDSRGGIYKGLQADGQVIAVKMLNLPGIDDRPFQNEIEILMTTHHQNIVQLIGYCRETRSKIVKFDGKHVFAEEIYTLLCFEYFQTSLDKCIPLDVDSGLDWQTRYIIIKGICEGLKYLHEGLESPIIHMDLKPSNILLDEKMTPRICDFGAAILIGERNTFVTIRAMGTIGYLPPEYIDRQIISKQYDIYSLGVILLQLVIGKQSYREFQFMSVQMSIELGMEKWKQRLQKTIDITLVEGYCQQVKKCLEIALRCLEAGRHKRPAIGDIVDTLNETEASLIPQRDYEPLLYVHPRELTFMSSLPLEVPRKKKAPMMSSSCLLHLDNKGNDRVAFMLVANNPSRYLTKEPLCGIVQPRCAYTLNLTMCNNKQQPSLSSTTTDSGADYFTLHSIMVGQYDLDKDTVSAEYEEFFKKTNEKAGHDVQEVTLNVICCQSDRRTSSEPTEPTVEIITKPDAQKVSSIDVHPMEPWIMTTHHGGSLRFWNFKTMATLKSIQDVTDEPVCVAKFIAREKWLIAGDCNGCIHVHNYNENEEVESFAAHNSCISTLAVHPLEPFVLSSSEDADHLIKLWNWAADWECTEFQGHAGTVTQVTFDPNHSNSFASASLDGTVKIWSIFSRDPSKVITLNLDEHGLYVDYFTRYDQRLMVVGCKDKTPQIWKLETRERVHELEGHTNLISAVNLHPELPMLITASLDGTIRIWSSTTYKLENIIDFNLGAVYAFGCLKGSRRIVVGCHQGIGLMEIPVP